MTDSPELRVSDAERDAVVESLTVASVAGRLTLGELTERTEAAFLAVTRADLDQITADLPEARPGGTRPGEGRKRIVTVMGDAKRKGRWRAEAQLTAVAVMGDITLDLREAEVPGREIEINATAVMGDVQIIVPDGIRVEVTGFAFMGDKKVEASEAQPGTLLPVVRVHARAVMGDVRVRGDEYVGPIRRALSSLWGKE